MVTEKNIFKFPYLSPNTRATQKQNSEDVKGFNLYLYVPNFSYAVLKFSKEKMTPCRFYCHSTETSK